MNRLKSIARNLRLILTQEISAIERRLIERADNYESEIDSRLDQRSSTLDQRIDQRLADSEHRIDERFDERTMVIDARLDDRFSKAEKQIDERFEALERRMDERIEMHERRTDRSLERNRVDIIDRTDVMLQILEQRLDKQRREVAALREALAAGMGKEGNNGSLTADTQPAGGSTGSITSPPPDAGAIAEMPPVEQIRSFRKLAESVGAFAKPKLQTTDATLYHRILEWKKVAHEGLSDFTADEREVVDYILSFIGDQAEREYTMQHMRRFLATLQRIPPPQSSADRVLELGSLLHLAPAIKKFCGYREVCCADFWESDKKIHYESVMQKEGPEVHTFELRNFNVERDPFPYPDNHFRAVLCCELLEHLQSDPMHMLWECNRVLMDDGFLLLTTPNIASCRSIEGVLIGCTPYLLSQYNRTTPADQHNREYAPYEVGIALAAAGFTTIELETEDVWLRSNPAIITLLKEVNLPTEMRGDNIFALARKSGPPVERYPEELYID
jgi:SAM-dependent methyltransferase